MGSEALPPAEGILLTSWHGGMAIVMPIPTPAQTEASLPDCQHIKDRRTAARVQSELRLNKKVSVNCHLSIVILGARQVGSALGCFTRSEPDQDRTGRGFAAAR